MLQECFLTIRLPAQILSEDITGKLHDGHPTASRDVDGPNDHDFVGPDTPFPDAPLRGLVLPILLSGPEESIYRSPNVLYELGQSNGIAQGRFVADLYLSLELTISRPLTDERVTESSVIVNILQY